MPELNSLVPVKSPVRQRITPLMLQTQKVQEEKQALVNDPLMLLREAQPMLGNPCYSTLRRWIADGSLRVWRAGKAGHYRVRLSEVRRFVGAGEQE